MEVVKSRRKARAQRRKLRTAHSVTCLPTLVREIPVYEVLDDEGVALIHNASLRILEEVGIDFRDDEALAIWRQAGAEVSPRRSVILGPVQVRSRVVDLVQIDGDVGLARVVARRLPVELRPRSNHRIRMDLSDLPSGAYLVRLRATDQSGTRIQHGMITLVK